MTQNTAAIVEDGRGNTELQVTIKTLIHESKRRSVLMSAALAHLMHLEPLIAKMENDAVETLYDQIKIAEAQAAETEEVPSIVVPEEHELPEPPQGFDSAIINPSDPTPRASDMLGEAAKALARSEASPIIA